MNLKTKRKTAIAFVLSLMMTMLSVVYCLPSMTNAVNASIISYARHNYSDQNLKSCTSYSLRIDNEANSLSTCAVIGDNNFVQDSDTAVVQISGSGGTGFIIDNHTIATAAHCVYDISTKSFIDFKIKITDTNGNELEVITPKYAHITEKFRFGDDYNEDELYKCDYAMINVENDLSKYEHFNLGVATNSFINKNSVVTVSGYPQYDFDNDNKLEWGARYKASGNIISNGCDDYTLNYNADMVSGDSGGPVYVERNYFGRKYKTAIAINACESYTNYGVKITSDLLKFYYSNPLSK